MPKRRTTTPNQLRDLIRAELLEAPPGALEGRLLVEGTLMREHGASRETVRQALTQLAAEGLVIRRPGFGTVPVTPPMTFDLTLPSFEAGRSRPGKFDGYASPLPGWDVVTTPDVVSRKTGDSSWGERCLRVVNIGQLGQERFAVVTSYVRADIAVRLDRREYRGDFWEFLTRVGDVEFGGQRVIVQPRAADSETAEKLGIPDGEYVQATEQVVRDRAGRVVFVAFGCFRRDVRLSLQSEHDPDDAYLLPLTG
jgi:GntR family transcriptional regulator